MNNFAELKRFLDGHIDNSTDTSTIDVFSLPCGIGKSTYLKHKISDCLNSNKGLIVVTDSLDRLSDYVNDDDLSAYISRNANRIVILTAENIGQEVKKIDYKSIILMSTQRYFGMTAAEIKALTQYKYGVRDKIIFDEKPYLYENIRIDISVVDNIDIALHTVLDNNINQAEKEWLCSQWQTFIVRFKSIIKELEARNTAYQYDTWYDKLSSVTDNDSEFTRLINKYRSNLNVKDSTLYKKILAIIQIAENGARFISYKKSKSTDNCNINVYDNYFNVIVDNRDKVLNVGAKCIVLDGTAALLPDYDSDFVNLIDCSRFSRAYPNLTIRFVDVPTTAKNKLCGKDGAKTIKVIADYINSLPYQTDCVFSFKDCANEFKKYFPIYDYFGNIKGKNQYNQLHNLTQIGVFRYPDVVYADIAGYNILSSNSKLTAKIMTQQAFAHRQKQIMYKYISADIEQNLFRSAVRNADCNEPIIYTILLNMREYGNIADIITQRFPKAKIEILPIPSMFLQLKTQSRKNKEISVSQKVLNWLMQQPKDSIIKISDMLSALQINYDTFKNAKKSKAFKAIIAEHQKGMKTGYLRV